MLRGDPDHARDDAEEAAGRAGVRITELTGADVVHAERLIRAVWGPGPVPARSLLRALAHSGTSLLGAFQEGMSVGTSVGFLGWNGGLHFHSHITAVSPTLVGSGIGFALKLWQRCLCLEHGVTQVRWTYDPLIARNAHFNLVKLGARVTSYLPDHYGTMNDAINADDHSDRFEVSWDLTSPAVARAIAGKLAPVGRQGPSVPVPRDYERLRRENPAEAQRVRHDTRQAFKTLGDSGRRPAWSDEVGGYVLVPPPGAAGEGS